MARIKNGRSRAGFTLIECMAALALFVVIVLMWQPLTKLSTSMQRTDEEMTGMLAGARELEELTRGGTVKNTQIKELQILTSKNKLYIVKLISTKASPHTLEITTPDGGYMPIVRHVKQFDVSVIKPNVLEYIVTMDSGKIFVGVLTDNGGEPLAKT